MSGVWAGEAIEAVRDVLDMWEERPPGMTTADVLAEIRSIVNGHGRD